MLELLDVQCGHRVLEIGAATGINAALLAELTGPTGQVVTIELDDDLATGARAGLTAAGYHQVEVICGDGAHRMVSTSALVCGFVPLRGTAEQTEHHVRLHDDVTLTLDPANLSDQAALAHALTYPAHEYWTGIHVHDEEPAEHLDLWLATTNSPHSFGRLSLRSAARASGLLNPALRWAGATLYDGGTIAYIAVQPHNDDTNGLGVIAHGPDSEKLAAQASDLLYRWDWERPSQPTITARPAGSTHAQTPSPAHIDRPHTKLAITW